MLFLVVPVLPAGRGNRGGRQRAQPAFRLADRVAGSPGGLSDLSLLLPLSGPRWKTKRSTPKRWRRCTCEPSKRWRWPSKPRITPRTIICSACRSTPSKSARTWAWTNQNLEALRAAALLHDIGKLAVPEHIISKPGKLTREEFEKMKIHPVVGAEILERVRFPYPVTPIVRSHHEKWDGTGYPDGLKGEEIPIGARILAAVDCLDALASDRQYRRALPLDEAMQKVVVGVRHQLRSRRWSTVLQRRYVELEAHGASAAAWRQPQLSTDRQDRARPGAGRRLREHQGGTAAQHRRSRRTF